MTTPDIAARAHQIADDLIGTCRSQHEFMTQAEIDDVDLQSVLHELMFECDCCGWWHSTEELNNDEGQEYGEMCDECWAQEYQGE